MSWDADGEGRGGEFGSSAEDVSEALTMTTYLDMLNDTTRNRAYLLAIQKAVKGGHHVLDIGYTSSQNFLQFSCRNLKTLVLVSLPIFTLPNSWSLCICLGRAGTGLLSMMAWCSMCKEDRSKEDVGLVTSCESYLPMFKLARKLLRANKVGEGVRLIHKRSDDLEVGIDMHCRADVLVSVELDRGLNNCVYFRVILSLDLDVYSKRDDCKKMSTNLIE